MFEDGKVGGSVVIVFFFEFKVFVACVEKLDRCLGAVRLKFNNEAQYESYSVSFRPAWIRSLIFMPSRVVPLRDWRMCAMASSTVFLV